MTCTVYACGALTGQEVQTQVQTQVQKMQCRCYFVEEDMSGTRQLHGRKEEADCNVRLCHLKLQCTR